MNVVSTRSQLNHPRRAGYSRIGKSNLSTLILYNYTHLSWHCQKKGGGVNLILPMSRFCEHLLSKNHNHLYKKIYLSYSPSQNILIIHRKFNKKSKYPPNSDCTWSLHVGENDYTITITITIMKKMITQ